MRQVFSPFLLLTFLFACFSLGACTKNNIPLVYSPKSQEIIPIVGAPSICIVTFTDDRPETIIGTKSNGEGFISDDNVADWVTQALGNELLRLGYVVTNAPTLEQAERNKAHYIITGKVEEVWLAELSSISYESRIKASINLLKGHTSVLKNTFNSSLSDSSLPLTNPGKDLLAKTLAEVVRPMALAVQGKITP